MFYDAYTASPNNTDAIYKWYVHPLLSVTPDPYRDPDPDLD